MNENVEYCIMPDNPPKWRNKRYYGTVRHEAFFGVRNRQKSIEDGLVIFLTPDMHNMSKKGIHFNIKFDKEVKMLAEFVWLTTYNKTINDFIKRYGRNYIMDYDKYFSETWVQILRKQFKEAKDYNARQEIKDNLYKNIQLTDRKKDEIWRKIVSGIEV